MIRDLRWLLLGGWYATATLLAIPAFAQAGDYAAYGFGAGVLWMGVALALHPGPPPPPPGVRP